MEAKKNIVIIGATGGIGQAIALKLTNRHTNLILVARDIEPLQMLADQSKLTSSIIYAVNLENYLERENFCDEIDKRFEKIDWVIYSAGFISKDDSMMDYKENVAKKTFEINFFAPFHITKRLAAKTENDGGFVFISSTAGISGNGLVPAYASSKGALNSFARSLALSWQETSKRSIIVSPGPTNTKMREELAGDSVQHQSPHIVADLVDKIITEASDYRNGSNLIVRDGKISFESK